MVTAWRCSVLCVMGAGVKVGGRSKSRKRMRLREESERPICAMRSYVRSPSLETRDYKNPSPILVSVVLWMAL